MAEGLAASGEPPEPSSSERILLEASKSSGQAAAKPNLMRSASSGAKQLAEGVFQVVELTSDTALRAVETVGTAAAFVSTVGNVRRHDYTMDEDDVDWEAYLDNLPFLYQCGSHGLTTPCPERCLLCISTCIQSAH